MRVGRIDDCRSRAVTEHGSAGAQVAFVARGATASVVRIELEPGGRLGMHPATAPQLFLVLEGEGTVASGDAPPEPVSPGSAVRWAAGEPHETCSEGGLVARVVEADALEPGF